MVIVIQSLLPDQYFSREQITRLETLMTQLRDATDQNRKLSEQERTELEELIDAELSGAAKRSAALADIS